MALPKKIFGLKKPLEFFKTVDLHEVYGKEFVAHKTFDSSTAEEICLDYFYRMVKTDNKSSNRGDFTCQGLYFDQKTATVVKKVDGIEGPFFKVKYSNVLSKIFVQIVFKELDLIIEDIKNSGKWLAGIHSRLLYIRYKTEMTFDDMLFVCGEKIVGDNVKSFCGRNDINFLHFVDYLCSHNVKRFSHLIIFHKPINKSQEYKWDVEKTEDGIEYRTYHTQTNYLMTPINIEKVRTYVDYIGFGGFKVIIETKETKNKIFEYKEMDGHIKELDEAIDIAIAVNNFKYSHDNKTPWNSWEDMGYRERIELNEWLDRYKPEPGESEVEMDYWEGLI